MKNEFNAKLSQEARPFLRSGHELLVAAGDSGCGDCGCAGCDSGSCSSGQCACGTGGGECGHVPPMPKVRP